MLRPSGKVGDLGEAVATTDGAPAGFVYQEGVLTPEEERGLVERLHALPLETIVMRGQVARRRTAHFGWRYGYETWRVEPGPPVPSFLEPLRERAAALAGVAPPALEEVLITEYPPGAGIGWHRDAPAFDVVVGVSLLAPCRLRFRQRIGSGWHSLAVPLAPRSAYRLAGPARTAWQHSIPPIPALRYSVTFRTLRTARAGVRSGDRRPARAGRLDPLRARPAPGRDQGAS